MHHPQPEEYNVLHIGPELSSPLDQSLVKAAKRTRIASFFVFAGIAFTALGLFGFNHSIQNSLDENEVTISALIDEVGTLNQQNLSLSQQVESQEAILQSIENDFTDLQLAFEDGGGDTQALADLFSSILADFSVEEEPTLSKEVVLTEVDSDSTFDILLVGNNGAHSDAILVASVNHEKEKISLISIPRDLYINGRRINTYYHYYGIAQLERMVESVTGLEIDQYAQTSFDGFMEIVDIVGGIDIYVDEAIHDGSYPNNSGGYSPYSIEVGHYHMNGEEALRYARSRKTSSDFDRSQRQQKILSALRSKVEQMDTVMDLKDLTQIFQAILTHTETDISLFDAVAYFYDYKDYELNTGFGLTSSNYLYSVINESGAYILLPKSGNFDEIQGVIAELVN